MIDTPMHPSHKPYHLLLAGLTILYALIFTAAAMYKLHSYWMGFDLGVHEQVLWNTIHGRIANISAKGATNSYLGVDIILVELLLAPMYALAPSTETMLIVQVVLASSGTIPLYLIARERCDDPRYGLLAACIYCGALPVQYAILYEFQIRTIGTVLFLWAFLFFERKQFWPFVILGMFAIWTRSDGSFTLAAFGLYALIQRRHWQWAIVPMGVGLGWLALCMKVLIPAFREDNGFLYGFVYDWLGSTPLEMVQTMLLRPGYVVQHVITAEKMHYLLELFAPLLFLPLLRPGIVLIALPSLLLNLLSPEHIHWSIRYHYQAFVIPFLLIATIYAMIDLRRGESWVQVQCVFRNMVVSKQPPARVASVVAMMLIAATLIAQIVGRSPLIHLLTRPRDDERIALADRLRHMIPEDAAITVTSAFGSRLARRREIYFFPGNIIYPPAFAERGDYLLADLHEVPPDDLGRLRQLQQRPGWHTLVDEQDFLLLEREREREKQRE